MLEVAQLGDGVGRREAQAAGQDEVGLEARRSPRRRRRRRSRRRAGRRPRRGSRCRRRSRRPGRRRRGRTAISVFAGVSDTMRCGSAAMVDARCPRRRSGSTGKAAGARRSAGRRWARSTARVDGAVDAAAGAAGGDEPGDEQEQDDGDERSPGGMGHEQDLRDGTGPEGASGTTRPLASRTVDGGVRGCDARSCLPFSRRFEQAPWGRRPDFRPSIGRFTVAGLCRIRTGFATTRR